MDKLKEKIIKMVNDDNYVPLTPTELAIKLEIKNDSDIINFKSILREMLDELYIVETKKGRIIAPIFTNNFVGKFISHRKGFGFVQPDKENEQDLYIHFPAYYILLLHIALPY